MSLKPLICPHCNCQLNPPAASATGMNCPRCTTWLEFDPTCLGTCISCHKMQQANPSHCIEPATASNGNEQSIALGYPGGQAGKRPGNRQESPRWEAVFGRFFSQR